MKTPLPVNVKGWAGLDRLNSVPGRGLTRPKVHIITLGKYLEEQFTPSMPANGIDDLHLPVHYLWVPSKTTSPLKVAWVENNTHSFIILD